jgi:hypothetical protein
VACPWHRRLWKVRRRFLQFLFYISVFCPISHPRLDAIKRVVQQQASASYQLEFTPPAAGPQTYKLYLMSDAYMGCDQEYDVAVTAGEGAMETD